jgi:hypothetical protein
LRRLESVLSDVIDEVLNDGNGKNYHDVLGSSRLAAQPSSAPAHRELRDTVDRDVRRVKMAEEGI